MRPYALSIAGFDPSSGAGITSDVKTFEAHQTYGLSVCTALTVQTDRDFSSVEWISATNIITQLEPLLNNFSIKACKIGLIKDWNTLHQVIDYLTIKQSNISIILDPILKASAGFGFGQGKLDGYENSILKRLALITPNYWEAMQITKEADAEYACGWLSMRCPTLLKGGHHPEEKGIDYLYRKEGIQVLNPDATIQVSEKHGSGCVLSSAITAQLARGKELLEACRLGKQYTAKFLASSTSLLGYHKL